MILYHLYGVRATDTIITNSIAKTEEARTLCTMNKEMSQTKTAHAELADRETVTNFHDPSPSTDHGHGSRQLVEHFQSIVRARAIYYPVAYLLKRELGRGRQGIVFLGLRQGARGSITRHAIKLFDPSIYSSAKKYWTDMGRLAIQISRLQSIRSPNLVARDIYEEANGIGYIQMEAVDGVDLRCFLHGRNINIGRETSSDREKARLTDVIFNIDGDSIGIQPGIALYIMRQALRGLETLHKLGFVHSDVKPANIMIDSLGYVKLIDFGRAVMINEKTNFLLGSPLYMAPETHRREPSQAQTDLYSVGLVGLELIRGKPLVDTTHMTESDLYQFKIDLLNHLPSMLPEHVRRNEHIVYLFQRFLDPNPERRFPSAEAAESGPDGLLVIHKQLALLGKDTEYGRELSLYLAKLDAANPNRSDRLDDL